MRKIIIVTSLFLLSSQIAFARVTDNPIDYGVKPESLGGNLQSAQNNTYYANDRQPKPNTYLTKDVRDLQAQIIELDKKNAQLELKLIKLEQSSVSVQTPATQTFPDDAEQTQRIDTLERRVSLLEKTLQNVSGAISNTVDLIKKLLRV